MSGSKYLKNVANKYNEKKMNKQNNDPFLNIQLREKAEQTLSGKVAAKLQQSDEIPADIKKLVHELQVHQLELEMQNDELFRTQLELETERNKYSDLYNNAPAGYCTLNKNAVIQEINLTGVKLLGKDKRELINRKFEKFIDPESQDTFYFHKQNVLNNTEIQSCELKMKAQNGNPYYVLLESIFVKSNNADDHQIRSTMSDITERKKTESELNERIKELTGVYSLEQLLESTTDIEEVFRQFVTEIVPQSMQFPDKTIVFLEIDGKFYCNREMNKGIDSHNVLATPIKSNGKKRGELNIGYVEDLPFIENFQQKLVNSYVVRLGRYIRISEAEQKLKQEQEYTETIISTAQAIMLVLDPTGKIVSFNPYMEELSGYKLAEVKGKDWFKIFLPERDYDRIRNLFKEAIGDIQTMRNVNPIITKAGREIQIEWFDKTVKDTAGNIIGLLAIGQDITERQKMQQEIASLKDFYQTILDNVNDGIWVTDKNDDLIYFNPGIENIAGAKAEDMIGMKITHDFPEKTTGQFLPYYNMAKKTLKPKAYEAELVTPAGRSTVQSGWLIPRIQNGKFNGMICTIQDITERKRIEEALKSSEQNLRIATQLTHVGHWQWNTQTGKMTWTDEVYKLFGVDKQRYVPNHEDNLKLVHPDDLDNLSKTVNVALHDKTSYHMEYRIVRPNGDIAWCHALGDVIVDEKDNCIGMRGSIQDITEKKNAEIELRKAAQQWNTTFNSISSALSIIDINGHFVQCNKAMLQFTGKPRNEIIGKTCCDLLHGAEGHIVDCSFTKMKKSLQKESVELQLNGKILNITVEPIFNDNGELINGVHIITDITARKQAEKALRESEQLLRQMAENISKVFWVTDAATQKMLYVSPAYEKIWQQKVEKLYDDPFVWTNFIHEDDKESVTTSFKEQASGKQTIAEFRIIRPDGSERWIVNKAFPLINENGAMYRIVGVAEDITERVNVNKALQESEQKYRNLFEQSNDAVFIYTTEGTLLDVNNRACQLLGYKKQALLKIPLQQIRHEEERSKFTVAITQTMNQVSQILETKLKRFDGSIIDVEISSRIVDRKNGIIQGIVRDITERKRAEETIKESEEKLKCIVENSSDHIFMLDLDYKYLSVNKTIADNIGKPHGEIIGRSIFEIYPEDITFQFSKNINSVVETGKSLSIEEKIVVRDNEFYSSTNLNPVKDDKGRVTAVIGIVRDITERKIIEDKIKASLKEKEVMLKEIHHRVKNNLQVLTSLFNIQARHVTGPENLEIFRDSQNRIRSMALVHEELYQSKNLADIDFRDYINKLVKELCHTYDLEADKVMIHVDVQKIILSVDKAIPCGLIMNELISNSIKHAFSKVHTTNNEIIVKCELKAENKVQLIVSDNGIGIPSAIDLDHTESLGLHLVNILVKDQLDGEIKINNKKGTSFQIIFASK